MLSSEYYGLFWLCLRLFNKNHLLYVALVYLQHLCIPSVCLGTMQWLVQENLPRLPVHLGLFQRFNSMKSGSQTKESPNVHICFSFEVGREESLWRKEYSEFCMFQTCWLSVGLLEGWWNPLGFNLLLHVAGASSAVSVWKRAVH